jgi:hypothetical protein
MFLSGRRARALLHAAGVSTWLARNALACGLAGPPIRAASPHLYDEARVRDLAARRTITWPAVFEACPDGIFLTRRDLDVTRSHDEIVQLVSLGWTEVSPWEWISLRLHSTRADASRSWRPWPASSSSAPRSPAPARAVGSSSSLRARGSQAYCARP